MSEFPQGLALSHFLGGPVKKNTLYITQFSLNGHYLNLAGQPLYEGQVQPILRAYAGDGKSACKIDGAQFKCPNASNMICEKARCPLQGQSKAPTAALTGWHLFV